MVRMNDEAHERGQLNAKRLFVALNTCIAALCFSELAPKSVRVNAVK